MKVKFASLKSISVRDTLSDVLILFKKCLAFIVSFSSSCESPMKQFISGKDNITDIPYSLAIRFQTHVLSHGIFWGFEKTKPS